MSYQSVVEMASSQTLLSRIVAAAAGEGKDSPLVWAQANIWKLASSPGWADAWAFGVDNATMDVNPDTGARPGVISDSMILGAVQAVLADEASA